MAHQLRRTTWHLLALLLCVFAKSGFTQEFNNFRQLGATAAATGNVTSITFDSATDTATLNYLNAAGASNVYTVRLAPSASIPDKLPAHLPPGGFSAIQPPVNDLSGIRFFTGNIVGVDSDAPPNWFRLTKFNDRFSGVFRVNQRLYSVPRSSENSTVLVRGVDDSAEDFYATRQYKISAVIDESYLQSNAVDDTPGHLLALESIHAMDGILTDNLGITVQVAQIIYRAATSTESNSQWYKSVAAQFEFENQLAVVIFNDITPPENEMNDDHPQIGLHKERLVVASRSKNYQLATAHHFTALLGIVVEPNTLMDWQVQGPAALPYAHLSSTQAEWFTNNRPPERLARIISYDELDNPEPVESAPPIDNALLVAEGPEASGLINDDFSQPSNEPANKDVAAAGTATTDLLVLLCMLSLITVYRREELFHR